MRTFRLAALLGIPAALLAIACSSSPDATTGGAGASAGGTGAGAAGSGGSPSSSTTGTGAGGTGTGGSMQDAAPPDDASDSGPPPVDTLPSNRDRLLGTYFDYLKASVTQPQSNGLSGSNVSSVCDLWQKLDPSSQATFLTLTARMQGSLLGMDGSSMLWHVTRLYRLTGGQGATANDPGGCGDGEFNRMMMSMDTTLHGALLAASQHKGAKQGNGKPDIADIPAGAFWRDSHDLGGAHAPFDTSDETEQGAPRGQTQYFGDTASAAANAPLGRMDLAALVDPLALEMDQDYDCVHASNPLCTYITYGMFCFPQPSALGTDIYTQNYGSFDPAWKPVGCGN